MILRFRLASTSFIPSTKTAMASSSTSSTFSLLNQLDAHLAATSSASTSSSNPTFTQTRHISSATASFTPIIKRQRSTDRSKIHSTSSVTTDDDDDDVPLSISRPLSSRKTNLTKKSKTSSGSSDIEEVFLKPQERLSKSRSKGKGRAKENGNHVIVVPSSSDLENESRPDYESWTLTALQKEAVKHSIKKSQKKEKLIEGLNEIWKRRPSNNPLDQDQDDSGSDLEMNLLLRNQGGDEEMGDETLRLLREARDDEDEGGGSEVGDLTFQLLKEAEEDGLFFPDSNPSNSKVRNQSFSTSKSLKSKPKPKSSAASVEDEEEDPEDEDDEEEEEESTSNSNLPFSVSSHLQQSILKDSQLYERILMFEPIALDEIMSVARKNGVKVKDRIQVRSWLDQHGITNYGEELTGKRSRH